MMKRSALIGAACSALLFSAAAPLRAAEYGTAEDAKAMLHRAVVAVTADKAKALDEFSKGEDGFKDRDLYVFCLGPDSRVDAHPNPTFIGQAAKDLRDKNGKPFAEEMLKVAQEGRVSEVSYMWPRLGTTKPVPKTAYVTKVQDQVCAVGYYK